MEVTTEAQLNDTLQALTQFGEARLDEFGVVGELIAGVRRAHDVGDTLLRGAIGHGDGRFQIRRAIVNAVNEMVMDVNQRGCIPFFLDPVAVIKPPEPESWKRKSSSRQPNRGEPRWICRGAASCPGHFASHLKCPQCCSGSHWDLLQA